MNKLQCPNCKTEFTPNEILEESTISWPDLNWIYFKCSNCMKTRHIFIDDGFMATVEFLGAPGPNWKIIEKLKVENLSTRMDPSYVHAWLDGKHYEFEKKK